MENDIKITVEKGIQKLVIRKDEAKIIHEVTPVRIDGLIDAPSRFFEKRKETFCELETHIIIDRNKMSIELIEDELNHFKTIVTGKLQLNPDFVAFGINERVTRSLEDLSSFLKMNRYWFTDKDLNAKLVSGLRSFKGKVSTAIESSSDDKANRRLLIDKVVKSDIPENFTIEIPVFAGQKTNKLEVEICIDERDAQFVCWLESPEAYEIILETRDRIMDKEIKKFGDYTIIEV